MIILPKSTRMGGHCFWMEILSSWRRKWKWYQLINAKCKTAGSALNYAGEVFTIYEKQKKKSTLYVELLKEPLNFLNFCSRVSFAWWQLFRKKERGGEQCRAKKSSVVRVTVPKSVGSVGRIFFFFLEIMGKIIFQNTVRNTYVTNKYTNMLGK